VSLYNHYTRWLKRGRQRAGVARVLRKPMTATEICTAARSFSPRIQLRDVWFLMQQLQERGLAVCLNPRLITGRLYVLTNKGRNAVRKAFENAVDEAPENVDWRKYAWVVRGQIRRLTLLALGQLINRTNEAQTATSIRKCVCGVHSVGLNPVLRALNDLAALGFVRRAGISEEGGCTLYWINPAGRRVLEQLKR
jgi:hypothetical protein